MKFIDLTGKRFGKFIVIERDKSLVQPSGQTKTRWKCLCECGNVKIVTGSNLKRGNVKSCGCYAKENPSHTTHGFSKTRIYHEWKGIIARCYNPNTTRYSDYGGRGITVCDEWREDFKKFLEWSAKNGYSENLTIDRIDNNKGYSPDNCRWTTRLIQANNKRNNHRITYNKETHTLSEWSRILNIDYKKLYNRLFTLNWNVERAFSTP